MRISDLEPGREIELKVNSGAIRRAFSFPRYYNQSVYNLIDDARKITAVTEREFSFECYLDINPRYSTRSKNYVQLWNTLVVPSIGNENGVSNPEFTGNERQFKSGDFLLPVFHIHTHPPGTWSVPSAKDLLSSIDKHRIRLKQNGDKFSVVNHEINIITSDGGVFFHQYKGNLVDSSITVFIADYQKAQKRIVEERAGLSLRDSINYYPSEIARYLQNKGAFKTLYCPLEDLWDHQEKLPNQKTLDRICRKFPYTARVTRKAPLKPVQKAAREGVGMRLEMRI